MSAIPTYLGRPVWTIPVNWDTQPTRRFSYELNEILLGQAAPKYQPIARSTVGGFTFDIELTDRASDRETVEAFEAFLDAVKGRLTGFWLQSQFAACKIVAPIGDATTEFYIEDQRLRDTFTNWSHLVFVKRLGLRQYARISNVIQDQGWERVTLADPVTTIVPETPPPATSEPIDATWECYRLLYVRLADDAQQIDFTLDNFGSASIKVVELPEEYTAIETGTRPVFLYEIGYPGMMQGVKNYTNLNVDIISNGETFTSWPILHDGHRQALEGGENSMKITTVFDASSPAGRLFPYPTPSPCSIRVWEIAYAAPDTRTQLFTGIVDSCKVSGSAAELTCVTMISALGRQFPRFFIQNRCNYFLFSAPCGLNRLAWRQKALVSKLGARYILVTVGSFNRPSLTDSIYPLPAGVVFPALYPADWFAFGYLEMPDPSGVTDLVVLRRDIESNLVEDGTIEIVCTAPIPTSLDPLASRLPDALYPGDVVWLYPGCDGVGWNGTSGTCKTKFNNFARWGGANIVRNNLSINAIPIHTTSGNKK
jgi:hypothetical protein